MMTHSLGLGTLSVISFFGLRSWFASKLWPLALFSGTQKNEQNQTRIYVFEPVDDDQEFVNFEFDSIFIDESVPSVWDDEARRCIDQLKLAISGIEKRDANQNRGDSSSSDDDEKKAKLTKKQKEDLRKHKRRILGEYAKKLKSMRSQELALKRQINFSNAQKPGSDQTKSQALISKQEDDRVGRGDVQTKLQQKGATQNFGERS